MWDTWKQEAYFQLNRDRLVNDFLKLKNIISPYKETYKSSTEINDLMND